MSAEGIDKILKHSIATRRRAQLQLAALSIAVTIIVAAVVAM